MHCVFILAACLGLAEAGSVQPAVNLGSAGNYVILTTAGITNIPSSVITGDIAVSPVTATSITGMALVLAGSFSTSSQVTGRVFAADYAQPTPLNLTTTVLHKTASYTDAFERAPADFVDLAGGLIGGLTLQPGLYKWNSVVSITSDLILDGNGNADAVWIFQISDYFSLAASRSVILTSGAQASNVFWQVAGYVVVKTDAHLEGIVLCASGVAFQNLASINGRLYGVSVALDMSTITEPAPTSSPTSSQPTVSPTSSIPTSAPTTMPTKLQPTLSPTSSFPTLAPTTVPTTSQPTMSPKDLIPTSAPTAVPTASQPTVSPKSSFPTLAPTLSIPTAAPTNPTKAPTIPTNSPTASPSLAPSGMPTTSVPTVSPTSNKPTSMPTISPTSSEPTVSPTMTSNGAPTVSPTTTSSGAPSISPTLPTSTPTSSPTICIAGLVSCCFAISQEMVQLYVNEIDITYRVIEVGGSTASSISYEVNFTEPSDTAVLAIKGLEQSEFLVAGLSMVCNSTRPGSPWNFVTETGSTWRSAASTRIPDFASDTFDPDWYFNDYTKGSASPAYKGSFPSLVGMTCSSRQVQVIGHGQGGGVLQKSLFYGMRKEVVQPFSCGSNSPTLPVTTRPTLSPTSTFSPTFNPPSVSPSESAPTTIPSQSPTYRPDSTRAPTFACVPATVTCCITAQQELVSLYIDEYDVTSSCSPQSGLADASVAKIITFPEPATGAYFAVMGFENNEIKVASVMVRCNSTSAASQWNFASNSIAEWEGINPSDSVTPSFPENWYSTTYTGGLTAPVFHTDTSYTLNSEACGPVNSADMLRVTQGNPARRYWSLRHFVTQIDPCGTRRPSLPPGQNYAPTSLPTAPTLIAPTLLPTTSLAPSTALPSLSPTSSIPTLVPTPTSEPSGMPTTYEPTISPIYSIPTSSPTSSPTPSQPTVSPTSSIPTSKPSTVPTKSQPTLSPTYSFPTSAPTTVPTTSQPTVSPKSSIPTLAPTAVPTMSQPTVSPTSSFPTLAPTLSTPTAAPTNPTKAPTIPSNSPTASPSVAPSGMPTTSVPTVSPTSNMPTSVPTISPTSSEPTVSPTTVPTTSTVSPTTVPTTSPTTGPTTASPTVSPSQSPTDCVQGIVTCCFTARAVIVSFYVNEQDLTPTVTPIEFLNDTDVTKTVTFLEPPVPSAIAIKGYSITEVYLGNMQLRCVSTKPESLWNLVSNVASDWKTIAAIGFGQKTDTIPEDWYLNFPSAGTNVFDATPGHPESGSDYNIDDTCGVPGAADKVKPKQKYPVNDFWSLRKYVNSTICGAPTTSPSVSPTLATLAPSTPEPTAPTTVAPTTLSPTTLPSSSPSKVPTSSVPTTAPTTSPSSAPISSAPTLAPTGLPTTWAPSYSPTLCIPAIVTCCFTVRERLVQVVVNDLDLTYAVTPQNAFNDVSVTKTLTFFEPSVASIFAIKGFENSDFLMDAGMMLRCSSTDPLSLWNFVSEQGTGLLSWKAVKAQSRNDDIFPECWFCIGYAGIQAPGRALVDNGYTLSNDCGAPQIHQKLKGARGFPSNRFWGLKKFINQTSPCIHTDSPTPVLTSAAPTLAPITTTQGPSAGPTSSLPTTSPSQAPTVLPSVLPSAAPSVPQPTAAPVDATSGPSTLAPTGCTTGNVTCCFSAQTEFVQLFVDDQDLTALVLPQGSFANIDITKTISFPEPHGPATIGFKGYEPNEIREASLMLRCSSNTPGSKWNFVSEKSTGLESWKTVAALDFKLDSFPSDWYANDYTGRRKPVSWSNLGFSQICT